MTNAACHRLAEPLIKFFHAIAKVWRPERCHNSSRVQG